MENQNKKVTYFVPLSLAGRRIHKKSDNTLHIEKVKRDDAGTYICQAQIKGRLIVQELPVSVVVNG